MTSSINEWDFTMSNQDDVSEQKGMLMEPIIKIRWIFAETCEKCIGAQNINILQYLYKKGNIVSYNHS